MLSVVVYGCVGVSVAVSSARIHAPVTDVDVIWMVESNQRLHPPRGDDGRARGPLQIHAGVCKDTGMDWEKCDDLLYSKQVFYKYCKRYKATTLESKARLWNGGPSRRGTDKYWEKCKAAKRKLEQRKE